MLAGAVRHALFGGGGRLRPKLCLAVAEACGDPDPYLADAVAAAVEMVHCASLVHDDLPCFDNADVRRGQPTVHRAFGETTAVLTGDHLIVLAFEIVGRASENNPKKLPAIVSLLARGVGAPYGIIAGQAWEAEAKIDAVSYRRAKTGALFAASAALGAVSAGASPQAWSIVGELIGEAYQVADDIMDVTSNEQTIGKPVGQDAAHGRPNAAIDLGLSGAKALFERLIRDAVQAIPACVDPEPVRMWIGEAEKRARDAQGAVTRDPQQ